MDLRVSASRPSIQTEQLAAATLRALSGNPLLHFEGGRLFEALRAVPVNAPHLQGQLADSDLLRCRAVADALAVRSLYSDASLHRRSLPEHPVERLIFDWLEQLRCESLAPRSLPGLRHNLIHSFRRWSDDFLHSGAAESSIGILLFALSQMAWSRLMVQALPETIQDYLEPVRAGIGPSLGPALAGLRRCRDDQQLYAEHALSIARDIAQRVQCEYEDEPPTVAARRGDFSLTLEFDSGKDVETSGPADERHRQIALLGDGYRVFTRRYDLEVQGADMLRPALAREYRDLVDQRLADERVNVGRLSRAFRALLAQPRHDGLQFGEESGRVDGRRLATIVSSPAERRVFQQEREIPVSDCVVSFLVDCSGSMKQYRSELVPMLDVMMRALGQVSVPCEILGFTTGAWNGGLAHKAWSAAGRPQNPGRLNEARHIVYKSAGEPWRRARHSIVAMLKPDIFREGIDGEAVQWACERLLARDEQRKVLFVLSDGCPMDSATHMANDESYLDRHLRSVVQKYTQSASVQILGVGLGLDLSTYYPRSMNLDLSARLGNAAFDVFLELLAGRGRR